MWIEIQDNGQKKSFNSDTVFYIKLHISEHTFDIIICSIKETEICISFDTEKKRDFVYNELKSKLRITELLI